MEQFDKHQLEKTDQQLFTDSFNVCWQLLKKKEYYLSEHETNIFSTLSLDYGHDMYEDMVTFMKKIINSNKHKGTVEKSKVESIKSGTAEATRNLGYDDNSDQIDQRQQQKQQVDKGHSQDEMISKKRNIPVDEIHSKKMFKADYKNNYCDDSNNAKNIQITCLNEYSIEKLHMIDFIKKEEELFTEQSITIKDEMLPITDSLIDVDKINNSHDHSIRLEMKSNEITNFSKDNNQSCLNGSIKNVNHKKKTRIRTKPLASKNYSFCTEENDDLNCTADENYSGTAKATRNLGYDSDYDELNQQRKHQLDKVLSEDKMISKKRNLPVPKIHSKKIFKADNKKNHLLLKNIVFIQKKMMI